MDKMFYESVKLYILDEFPQIHMHGGKIANLNYNANKKELLVELSGECNGCALFDNTSAAIKRKVTNEFKSVNSVEVSVV